ncbi:Menaquinone biosynthesis related protein, putative DHNA-CoA thioesterase [Myxococcus hansupus]|uniref:Menaquinone biosynthesis related protein, putative DHNA-CoA thioesterase n=1 Tax=Pseudomyxococcus hansupus TaxID=1297742 RepID=A0A0H4X3A2_9BACT|nr:alpha/beta hydrolase [Myxococcus hansupus]AKQ70126.1 Menaquinone biosynthesis related protein, putative DHNA-CoA thioesterase [Myxococcus hansupus]
MTSNSRTVQGPAGRLAVTETGSGGLPVVFVHSNAGRREQWAAQQAHLKQRSVSLDLRGVGESDLDDQGRYGAEAVAEDVQAVADALGLERFVLVGHSFGGNVVGEYARRWPERLAGLVIVDAAGTMPPLPPEQLEGFHQGTRPESYRAFMDAWYTPPLQNAKPHTHESVMRWLHTTPREVVVGALESMLTYDSDRVLAHYKGPFQTLVVDAFIQPNAYHLMYPGTPHTVFSGVSHWLMMDDPERFNAALDAFLATLPQR